MNETKICIKCGKELPLTEENYSSRKNSKDGFCNECKKCRGIYLKQYRKDNKESITKSDKEYYLNNKKDITIRHKQYKKVNKEATAKYSKQYKKDNREILAKYSKEHYENNKEYYAKIGSEYHKNNRDKCNGLHHRYVARKRELPNDLTSDQWTDIKTAFDNKCCYCEESKPLAQEHFIALSKGGGYTVSNILPACKSCNSSKNNKDFLEWYPKQKFYSDKRRDKILEYLEKRKEESRANKLGQRQV